MKTFAKRVLTILILGIAYSNTYAQGVCITVTNASGVPQLITNKKDSICRNTLTPPNFPNIKDTVTLRMPNANPSCTPIPNASYRWRHLGMGIDYFTQSVVTKDTGVWVGYITNTVTSAVYSDTVHLSYYPLFVGDISAMTPNSGGYCPLVNTTISLTTSGAPFGSYQWYDKTSGPLNILNGATASTFNLTFAGLPDDSVLQVYGKDVHGCMADSLLSGYYNELLSIPASLGPDLGPVCEETSVTVQNRPGNDPTITYSATVYQYFRDGVLICPYGPAFPAPGVIYNTCNVPLPTAGTVKVWVTVTSTFVPCINADTINVTVIPIPVVDLPSDSIVCFGQDMKIKSTMLTTASVTNYKWIATPPAGFTDPGVANANSLVNVSAKYNIEVKDVNNCGAGKDSIMITANPQIFIGITNDTTICKYPLGGTTVNLNANVTGGAGGFTYFWPGPASLGLSANNIANPTATPTIDYNFTTSAIYDFYATDINNCKDSNTVSIRLYLPPLGTVSDPIVISETNPYTIDVSTSTNSGFSFAWDNWIDTLTADTIYNVGTEAANYIKGLGTNPSIYLEYMGTGAIFYEVTVHNTASPADPNAPNSCINRDTIKVQYISDNTLLYVPNIFSPNAVDPENQFLKIYGDNLDTEGFKLIVFNKWGNLVYETTDLSEAKTRGWDGGAKMEGVYSYVIVGRFKNGKDVTESPYNRGTFTLVK